MKAYKIIFTILTILPLISGGTAKASDEPFAPGKSILGTPKIIFDEPTHNFGTVEQGKEVKHSFIFKNIGTADLIIKKAKGSCGCTAAATSTGPYKPGEQGSIQVSYDSRGKFGSVFKDVRVESNDPKSPVMIAIQGMVMEGSHPTMATGEVLFKGTCAECHSIPAKGKKGKELYMAACAMCHDPPPESNPHKNIAPSKDILATLPHSSLRGSITNGIPGTSMPGFASKKGGPLSKKQVKSLLKYLESIKSED